jgi:hypothetical protein
MHPGWVDRVKYLLLHFCSSSALRVALLGFLLSWKCLTGGVSGPTRVVRALLFRYWHSRGSMADASHSLTAEGEQSNVFIKPFLHKQITVFLQHLKPRRQRVKETGRCNQQVSAQALTCSQVIKKK